jgi:type VI secretion system protein VasD
MRHRKPSRNLGTRNVQQVVSRRPVRIRGLFFAPTTLPSLMKIKLFARRALPALAACAFAVILASCASSGGTTPPPSPDESVSSAAQTANTASQAAGPVTKVLRAIGLARKPSSKPSSYALPLRIFAADNLNAGRSHDALALVLKVYHLRSADQFEQVPFDDFLDDGKIRSDLGDALIDSRQMLLLPGQRYVSTEQLPADAHYIGFVALFRGPAARRWRFVYDVPKSSTSGITLGVHACAMSSTAGTLLTQLAEPANSLASVHCPNPGS